jgi:hypothetical protein
MGVHANQLIDWLRGIAKARGEWNVICLAVNLKRLHRIGIA